MVAEAIWLGASGKHIFTCSICPIFYWSSSAHRGCDNVQSKQPVSSLVYPCLIWRFQTCSIKIEDPRFSSSTANVSEYCTTSVTRYYLHPSSLPPDQEDHQTQVETAQERTDAGRPVGRDYIPLSQSPHLSQLTFGRKPSKSSAELPSSKPTAVGTAVEEGGDASGSASVKKSETELPPLTLQILPMAPRETRRISSDSTNGVSVVGGAARASIDSRGACSETPSATSSRRRHTATMSSSHKGKSQQQQQQQSLKIRPTMSNRGAAGRVRFAGDSTKDDYNSSGGGSIMSPSPELLYASGRITPARYHEMLAELDGRGGGGGGDAAGGAGGGGISSLCGAAPASTRKAAVPSQPNVGGARRRTEPAAIERR